MKKFLVLVALLTTLQAAYTQKLGCSTTAYHVLGYNDRVSFFDTVYQGRGIGVDQTLWESGTTLRIRFMSGSPASQQRVINIARQWEKFANIRFDFIKSGNSDIRILLSAGEGHASLVGRKAITEPEEQFTMLLDTADLGNSGKAWQTVVLHQFGHALGLQHEHATPLHGILWNKAAIYQQFGVFGLSKEEVDEVIFPDLNLSHANGTMLDRKSIMVYPVLKDQTTNGYEVSWNGELSENDKNLIRHLYPRGGYRQLSEKQAVMSKDNIGITVVQNSNKEGLSFYPTIDIKSTTESSKIYVCVLLYDENGDPLPDKNGNYAFGSTVAAGKTTNLIANTNLQANKNKAKDYELFIPFSEIPLETGQQKLKVKLIVVQVLAFGEMQTLHQTDAVSYEIKTPGTAGIANPVELTFPPKTKS
jgi:serralysin